MNLDLEAKVRKAAAAEVPQVDLWKRIELGLTGSNTRRTWGRASVLVGATGVVVLILLVMAFTPQGRALAQGIIEQIGNITFLTEKPSVFKFPKSGSQFPGADSGNQLTGLPQEERSEQEQGGGVASAEFYNLPEDKQAEILDWVTHDESDTLEKAESILGAKVLQASFLPGGYALDHIEATRTDAGVRVVYSTYAQQDESGEKHSYVLLTQTLMPGDAPAGFGAWQIGENAVVSDTIVRSLPGKYVQGAAIAVVPQDILSWSEDGFDFSLIIDSGSLSLEELRKIAAGLESSPGPEQ